MIIIKNKFIPFGNYKSCNFFGLLFTKSDLSEKDKNHEEIHTVQIIELAILFSILMLVLILLSNLSYWWLLLSVSAFYIWYGLEYLIIRLFNLKDKQNDCYHEISLEEEAYNNDDNLEYLDSRKPFSWIKYIKINSNE